MKVDMLHSARLIYSTLYTHTSITYLKITEKEMSSLTQIDSRIDAINTEIKEINAEIKSCAREIKEISALLDEEYSKELRGENKIKRLEDSIKRLEESLNFLRERARDLLADKEFLRRRGLKQGVSEDSTGENS